MFYAQGIHIRKALKSNKAEGKKMGDAETSQQQTYVEPSGLDKELKSTLAAVRKCKGVQSYSLSTRDGVPKGSYKLCDETHEETLDIMSATIYGAAITAQGELRKKEPKYVKVDAPEGALVIFKIQNYVLGINIGKDSEAETLSELEKIILNLENNGTNPTQ